MSGEFSEHLERSSRHGSFAKLCAFHVHPVNLKDRLRNIETNRANLAHERLPSLVVRFSATTPWHFDAARWAPSTASFSTDSTWLCDVRLSGSGHRNRWHFMSTRPNRKRRRERAAGRINQNHQITLCAGGATILLLGCISHAVAASPSPVTPAPQP